MRQLVTVALVAAMPATFATAQQRLADVAGQVKLQRTEITQADLEQAARVQPIRETGVEVLEGPTAAPRVLRLVMTVDHPLSEEAVELWWRARAPDLAAAHPSLQRLEMEARWALDTTGAVKVCWHEPAGDTGCSPADPAPRLQADAAPVAPPAGGGPVPPLPHVDVTQAMCKREWPHDLEMQSHCHVREADARQSIARRWRSANLPDDAETAIRVHCGESWPEQIAERDWCEQQQLEWYRQRTR